MKSKTIKHKRVLIIGSESAGKTCFLAGLAILDEADRHSHIKLYNSPDTQAYMNDSASAFRHQEWPASTTAQRLLQTQIRYRSRYLIDIDFLDYPGESLRNMLSKGQDTNPELLAAIQHAEYILLMIDPTVDINVPDVGASRQRYHERTGVLTKTIYEACEGKNDSTVPIFGIILTKADLIPVDVSTPDKAENYLQNVQPGLYTVIKDNLQNQPLNVFAISSVGKTETNAAGRLVPSSNLNPTGYNYVFDWVIRMERRRKQKLYFTVFTFLLFATIGISLVWLTYNQGRQVTAGQALREMQHNPTIISKDQILRTMPQASTTDQDEFVSKVIEDAMMLLNDETVPISELKKQYEVSITVHSGPTTSKHEDLGIVLQDLRKRIMNIEFQRVERNYANRVNSPEVFKESADNFLDEFPASTYVSQINDWLRDFTQQLIESDRRDLHAVRVTSLEGLNRKVRGVREFVNRYPNEADTANMRLAADLGENLGKAISDKKVILNGITIGPFVSNRYVKVRIHLGDTVEPHVELQSENKVPVFEYRDNLTLDWSPGKNIRIVVETDEGWIRQRYTPAAFVTIDSELPLADLHGRVVLVENNDVFANTPFFDCQVLIGNVTYSESDWNLIRHWIIPGDGWRP